MSLPKWLQRREYALPLNRGIFDKIMLRAYSSINAFKHWNHGPSQTLNYEDVYNMEFSPRGNVLVAACEKKSILLFDAINQRQTYEIKDILSYPVKYIKFLDERMFATCSENGAVALWDVRYLKMKFYSLPARSYWINIEYSHRDNLLVTCGLDGSIFTWDINSHIEEGIKYRKALDRSELNHCRISPDGTKLVISSDYGYLMIVHNLDLSTLHKDLKGFRPFIYYLMQKGLEVPKIPKFDHVFSKKQKQNRVELVTDFPDQENNAQKLVSLRIHPQGHSILSRKISFDEKSKWSYIHDIYEEPGDITERIKEKHSHLRRKRKLPNESDDESRNHASAEESSDSDDVLSGERQPLPPFYVLHSTSSAANANTTNQLQQQSTNQRSEWFFPDIWFVEATDQESASSSGALPATVAPRPHITSTESYNTGSAETFVRRVRSSFYDLASYSDGSSDSPPIAYVPSERVRTIFQNPKKLMYYIQEPVREMNFIDEPSFSADGRIVCYPYGSGVRLMGYSETCSEYPTNFQEVHSIKQAPRTLKIIKELNIHDDKVLSTKFSPCEPLLVSGCKSGKIVWYHPVL